jgi:hypothetical protein
LRTLPKQSLQRPEEVALFQEIVAHRIEQRFGVQIEDVLRSVPRSVSEFERHED